jgi:hypothetical protein
MKSSMDRKRHHEARPPIVLYHFQAFFKLKKYTQECMHRAMIHPQEASTFSIRVSPLVLGIYLIIKNLSKLLVQLQNPKLQSSDPIRMMFQ